MAAEQTVLFELAQGTHAPARGRKSASTFPRLRVDSATRASPAQHPPQPAHTITFENGEHIIVYTQRHPSMGQPGPRSQPVLCAPVIHRAHITTRYALKLASPTSVQVARAPEAVALVCWGADAP